MYYSLRESELLQRTLLQMHNLSHITRTGTEKFELKNEMLQNTGRMGRFELLS